MTDPRSPVDQESDDDFVEEDIVDEEEAPVKEAFEEILAKVKNDELQWAKGKGDLAQFKEKYGIYFNDKVDKNQTLLHVLAYEAKPPNNSLKRLVQYLIKNHPTLMLVQDTDEKTPLYVAICEKKSTLVRWMIDKYPEIAAVFEKECNRSDYCLHAAIRNRLPSNVTVELVKKATKKALIAEDVKGYTPLHLAVEYGRCTDSQYNIVKALIEQGDSALDKVTKAPDCYSPYRWHMHTRERAERQQNNARKVNVRVTAEAKTIGEPNLKQSKTGKESGTKEDPRIRARSGSYKLSPQVTGANIRDNLAPKSTTSSRNPSSTRQKEDQIVTEASAEKIRQEMKVHYLRTRGPKEALDGLYGTNKDGRSFP
jgi:ankyrin repeat protein